MATSGRTVKAYLIYSARTGNLRVVSRTPSLHWDEVAFNVTVNVPDPWGRLAGSVVIDLPENGPAVVEVTPKPITPADQVGS